MNTVNVTQTILRALLMAILLILLACQRDLELF